MGENFCYLLFPYAPKPSGNWLAECAPQGKHILTDFAFHKSAFCPKSIHYKALRPADLGTDYRPRESRTLIAGNRR